MDIGMPRQEKVGEYTVIWDGTDRAPWGRFLTGQTERQHAAQQRPFLMVGQLSDDAIVDILTDYAAGAAVDLIAGAHHVHPSTVEYIVNLATSGTLRRKSA